MAYSFSMPEMNFGNMFGKKAPEEEELPQSEADYNAMADAFNATNAEATAELDDRVRYEEMFDQPTIDIPTYPMAETEYGPASEPTPTETPTFDLPQQPSDPLSPVGGPQIAPEGAGEDQAIDASTVGFNVGEGEGDYNYSFNQPTLGNIMSEVQGRDAVDLGQGLTMEGTPVDAVDWEQFGQVTDVDPLLEGPTAATIDSANVVGPEAAEMAYTGGFNAAQITPEQEMALGAQEQQIQALSDIASGELSPVLEQQRERGIQNVLAMMSSQRGVPTSALVRAGMQGIADVERSVQEAASQQQLQAIQALGQAGTQMRQQDIGLAAQQAGFEQEASRAGFEKKAESAMQAAGFQQQANAMASQQSQERAVKDAEFEQRSNEMAADIKSKSAYQNADAANQMSEMRTEIEAQRLSQEASFQQEAGLSNQQMEQARTIAEAQVNAEVEQTRNALVASLVQQGVSLELAEQRADQEAANQREELTYRYWAAREGAIVEIGKYLMDQAWFWESSTEQLTEELAALEYLIGQQIPGFAAQDIGQSPLSPLQIIENTTTSFADTQNIMPSGAGVRNPVPVDVGSM